MCETTDPVTGVKDHCNLIRVSVVNGLDPSEVRTHMPYYPTLLFLPLLSLTLFYHSLSVLTKVLLDSLVSPTLPITEWRSNIHGIGEDDLQGVRYNPLSSSLLSSSPLTLH